MLDTPLASRYQEQAVQELKQRPPAAVVFVRSNVSWLKQPKSPDILLPYLTNLLDREYQLVGGFVRDRETAGWLEPVTGDRVNQCSLLVFERKRAAAQSSSRE